jgi:uncharacterized membrane protein
MGEEVFKLKKEPSFYKMTPQNIPKFTTVDKTTPYFYSVKYIFSLIFRLFIYLRSIWQVNCIQYVVSVIDCC